MTVTDEVVETKLEEEFYIGEEGTEEPTDDAAVPLKFEDGTEVARGSHAVPKGVAVEELKNYGGVRIANALVFLIPNEIHPLFSNCSSTYSLSAPYDRPQGTEKFLPRQRTQNATRKGPLRRLR